MIWSMESLVVTKKEWVWMERFILSEKFLTLTDYFSTGSFLIVLYKGNIFHLSMYFLS